jgi:hypothetical protein
MPQRPGLRDPRTSISGVKSHYPYHNCCSKGRCLDLGWVGLSAEIGTGGWSSSSFASESWVIRGWSEWFSHRITYFSSRTCTEEKINRLSLNVSRLSKLTIKFQLQQKKKRTRNSSTSSPTKQSPLPRRRQKQKQKTKREEECVKAGPERPLKANI